MNRRNLIGLVFILSLLGFGIWIDLPGDRNIGGKIISTHEGLDLQGGVAILLKAAPPPNRPDHPSVTADDMTAVQAIVGQRVNALGVSEPQIQQQGSDHLLVELPGLQDQDTAIKTIGNTGVLEW
ncbi:MAG TPA: protein translocase subunit SecD, partial [Chloroflexota bacterium]|nr:protein translocase subunit SecD [Chloroflexota bacterium]